MQIYHFTCKHCGYELKLPLGSSDLDQVLTDVNADYADYHLFRCDKESKFVYADIYSKCPRCTQDLVMETRTPFADDDDDSS